MKILSKDERIEALEKKMLKMEAEIELLKEQNTRGREVNEKLRVKYPLSEENALHRKEIEYMEAKQGIPPTEDFRKYSEFVGKCKE